MKIGIFLTERQLYLIKQLLKSKIEIFGDNNSPSKIEYLNLLNEVV